MSSTQNTNQDVRLLATSEELEAISGGQARRLREVLVVQVDGTHILQRLRMQQRPDAGIASLAKVS